MGLIKRKNKYWTLERCLKSAKRYSSKSEWRRADEGAYYASWSKGWHTECCRHMKTPPFSRTLKWTLKACSKEAKKFKKRIDWSKKSASSYYAARRNGWLDLCCKHMKTIVNKWNVSTCIKDAKRFDSRSEWQDNSGGAYSAALRNNWLDQCCGHMTRPINVKWTYESCKKEAKKYKTRTEWQKKSSFSYRLSSRNKWTEEFCSHMKIMRTSSLRSIYVFKDSVENYVYIGLTNSIKTRYSQHLSKRGINSNRFRKSLKNKRLKFKIVKRDLAEKEAQELERSLVINYKKRGWTVLNQAKAGALGGGVLKWTLKACIKDAKKYKTKSQWENNSPSAYGSARSNLWLTQCCGHMVNGRIKWTSKRLIKDAKKYKTKREWSKNSSGYGAAFRYNLIDECSRHMIPSRKPKNYWTKQTCIEDAKRFKTRKQWEINSSGAYTAARKNGWKDECFNHMEKIQGKWDINNCIKDAKKFKSRNQWQKGSRGAYHAAIRNGWLDQCCGHMSFYGKRV